MILIILDIFKSFSQKDYDSLVDSIKLKRFDFFGVVLEPHSHAIFYGTCTRTFYVNGDSRKTIRLQCILDKTTNQTHILTTFFVPYSAVPLLYQINIISAEEQDIPDLSILYNLDFKELLRIGSIFNSFWKNLCFYYHANLHVLLLWLIQMK